MQIYLNIKVVHTSIYISETINFKTADAILIFKWNNNFLKASQKSQKITKVLNMRLLFDGG